MDTDIYIYSLTTHGSEYIHERMLNLAGYFIRHKKEMAHNLILWTPT